MTFLEETK